MNAQLWGLLPNSDDLSESLPKQLPAWKVIWNFGRHSRWNSKAPCVIAPKKPWISTVGNAFGDSSLCGCVWKWDIPLKIAVLHGKMITNHWIFRYIPLYLINLIFRQTHVANLERTVKNASNFLWITKIILVDTS